MKDTHKETVTVQPSKKDVAGSAAPGFNMPGMSLVDCEDRDNQMLAQKEAGKEDTVYIPRDYLPQNVKDVIMEDLSEITENALNSIEAKLDKGKAPKSNFKSRVIGTTIGKTLHIGKRKDHHPVEMYIPDNILKIVNDRDYDAFTSKHGGSAVGTKKLVLKFIKRIGDIQGIRGSVEISSKYLQCFNDSSANAVNALTILLNEGLIVMDPRYIYAGDSYTTKWEGRCRKFQASKKYRELAHKSKRSRVVVYAIKPVVSEDVEVEVGIKATKDSAAGTKNNTLPLSAAKETNTKSSRAYNNKALCSDSVSTPIDIRTITTTKRQLKCPKYVKNLRKEHGIGVIRVSLGFKKDHFVDTRDGGWFRCN